MIAIVDYGVGNLFSLTGSLRHLGLDCAVTADARTLEQADHIILPGVGAFGDAMEKLRATGLIPALDAQVRAGKPFLGICLGMQLLFEESLEYGRHAGLGYLPGRVVPLAEAFDAQGIRLKVPHIGWNDLTLTSAHPLMRHTQNGDFVYFVHSYYAVDCRQSIAATAHYGVDVPAAVARGNVCGCQFHPEKSGPVGLRILQAFAAFDGKTGGAC